MDVREATRQAKRYVTDLYTDEAISHVSLEEAAFDELAGDWKITIGFFRLWNPINALTEALTRRPPDGSFPDRSYKVVRIKDSDGRVISLTDRLLVERAE